MTVTWMTGADASDTYGYTIAEIDEAAATGVIPAQYQGWMLMVAKPDSGGGVVDEVQHIEIIGGPNGGSFALALDDQPTAPITYHPSATQITTALTALPNVGTGNISTSKVSNWGYDVTFKNALGAQDVAELVPDYSLLKPTDTTSVVVSTITPGVSPTTAATATAKETTA